MTTTTTTTTTRDSVTSRQIVDAFFDFLTSVDGVDGNGDGDGDGDVVEAIEVAKDCLTQVFHPHLLPPSLRPPPHFLLNLFTSSPILTPSASEPPPPSSLNHASSSSSSSPTPIPISKDDLFHIFFDALEKNHFFKSASTGQDDDNALLDTATSLFHDAINEIQTSHSNLLHPTTLADALKTLGNKSMHSLSYSHALDCYSCAIALRQNNAVYYCNRAAAYTHLQKYNEAITDCLKSIEIDPSYSKAYSRMGLAYYAQGNYSDAIRKGFRKALELDPNNDAVKENIRVAEQKLMEELEQRNQNQRQGYSFGASEFPVNVGSMFSSMSGNESRGGEDNNGIASMVENIARTFRHGPSQAPTSESATFEAGSTQTSNFTGMFRNMRGQTGDQGSNSNSGGSFSLNFGGETPEELTQAFSLMTGMFSGASPPPPPPQGRRDST